MGWAFFISAALSSAGLPSTRAAAEEATAAVARAPKILLTTIQKPLPDEAQPPSVVALPLRESLDGRTVACRAARKWLPAHALRARGRTVVEAYQQQDECERRAAQSIATFLNLQACQQEDLAAANGLRAYYTRIAVAEQMRLGAQSKRLVADEEAKVQAARNSGLAAGADLSDFQRRQIELEDQQLQLRSQDRQLGSLLAQVADSDYAMDEVQQEELNVRASRLDCPRLVAIALRERYDLRSWTFLASQLDEDSAPSYARLLSTSVGAFGLPLPTIMGLKNLLCAPDFSGLASNLRREICLTVETHRSWIQQTVDEKCTKLELAYRRLELAQQTIASWQARREQLAQLDQLGKPEPEQSALAQVGWMQSRAEEIRRRLEARLAEVDLAEATGQLAHRCCTGQAWLVTGDEP